MNIITLSYNYALGVLKAKKAVSAYFFRRALILPGGCFMILLNILEK